MGVTKLFVANWKMEISFEQQVNLAHQYVTEFKGSDKTIVLCPSYEALEAVQSRIASSSLHLGSQGCSPYTHGPYTGQVSAESLVQLGCTYTIIGHSEWRAYTHETYNIVAQQFKQLSTVGITPIVCMGDDIKNHLNSIAPLASQRLCIAYEPRWAIGTGKIPQRDTLQDVCSTIHSLVQPHIQLTLLYGGSVNPNTIEYLNIPEIDGFLIGSASLDVQKLKKIVSYS